MKKIMLVNVLACATLLTACSGQQVASTAIGVAKVPFKVVGTAATVAAGAAGSVAGTVAGTAAGGPLGGVVGGAVGGSIASTVVGAITP